MIVGLAFGEEGRYEGETGGKKVPMQGVSTPIHIQCRHWGILRIGLGFG